MSNAQLISLNITITRKSRQRLSEIMEKLSLPNLNTAVETIISIAYKKIMEKK